MSKFTEKSQKKVTTSANKPTSMSDIIEDTIVEPVKSPDVKKTVHIEHELNEKLRLMVFQKKYTSERAVVEAGLRLLFKKENI